MARKRRKRGKNRRGFQAIPFQTQLSLATLGDDAVLQSTILSSNFGEDIYAISIDATWSIRDLTVGEVPIEVGYSHSDLVVAEVLEFLQVEITDPDDIIQRERSTRPVRRAAMFGGPDANMVLNDGKKIRTPLRFSIGDGHNLNFWATNRSGATLTTGAIIELNGILYGRWQR